MQSIEAKNKARDLKVSLGVNRFISLVTRSKVIKNSNDEVHHREDGVIIFKFGPKGAPIDKRFIPSDSMEE